MRNLSFLAKARVVRKPFALFCEIHTNHYQPFSVFIKFLIDSRSKNKPQGPKFLKKSWTWTQREKLCFHKHIIEPLHMKSHQDHWKPCKRVWFLSGLLCWSEKDCQPSILAYVTPISHLLCAYTKRLIVCIFFCGTVFFFLTGGRNTRSQGTWIHTVSLWNFFAC